MFRKIVLHTASKHGESVAASVASKSYIAIGKFVPVGCVALAALTLAFQGCTPQTEPAGDPANVSTGGPDGEAGHEPAGNGHAGHDHDHAEEGPHGGHIIELGGGEHHAELVHDESRDAVGIYLLDGSLKKAQPADADEIQLNLVIDGKPRQFRLEAAPLEGETQASYFELIDHDLAEAFEHEEELTGRFNVTISGQKLVGDIDHHAHSDHSHGEHEEHDHEHDDDEHREDDHGHEH